MIRHCLDCADNSSVKLWPKFSKVVDMLLNTDHAKFKDMLGLVLGKLLYVGDDVCK